MTLRSHKTVLRIHEIFTKDPDPRIHTSDPAIFVSDLNDVTKKIFFCLLLFESKFTSFFKDKKSERIHKTVEVLLDDKTIKKDPDPNLSD